MSKIIDKLKLTRWLFFNFRQIMKGCKKSYVHLFGKTFCCFDCPAFAIKYYVKCIVKRKFTIKLNEAIR